MSSDTPPPALDDRDGFALYGYTDELSVEPGASVRVFVTARSPYTASLVRLDDPAAEPPTVAEIGAFPAHTQTTYPGSYVRVPHDASLDCPDGVTIVVALFATTPDSSHEQGVVTKWRDDPAGGWGLFLAGGRLVFRAADEGGNVHQAATAPGLLPRRWYRVTAGLSPEAGKAYVIAVPLWHHDPDDRLVAIVEQPIDGRIAGTDASLLLAAGRELRAGGRLHTSGLYNGKLDNPIVFDRGLSAPGDAEPARIAAGELTDHIVCAWDFSQRIAGADVVETRRGLHGTTVNAPMRAVTGSRWRAREQHFREAPSQYSAIHFHEDDLDDVRWDESFRVELADDLESGAYAVRVRSDGAEDRIPLLVTPRPAEPRARIAVLVPVYTYIAYGNEHLWERQQTVGRDGPAWRVGRAENPAPADRHMIEHAELGRSIYDLHADGSGVCYSSRRRPMLNMRDDYRAWLPNAPRHFSADLLLLRWLRRRGFAYDLITDETLHARGDRSLSSYAAVITGSHPEYSTGAMLDTLEGYLAGGGRLMYLGGNGFYWVTSFDEERPYLIEVRRGYAGTRNWTSAPGEGYHGTTGEIGGLWRHRGRPPQQLVGVGFTALGYRGAAGYARTARSYEDDVSFVFEGVESEVFGEFGLALGGAAGDEIDRYDPALGSPPESLVLASSSLRHDGSFQLCVEDIQQTAPDLDGQHDPLVRADMVYLPLPRGAAVFSVGSINWIASLAADDGNNDVARITENVLRRFLGDAPG